MKKVKLGVVLLIAILAMSFLASAQPAAEPTPAVSADVVASPVDAAPTPVDDTPSSSADAESTSDKTATNTADEEEISWDELFALLGKVIDDWRTLGIIGIIIAIIALLIAALRLKPINDWLEARDLKWIKVYVAAGLGALLAFFTSYSTGAGWLQSICAGLIFGLAAVGGHQARTKGNKNKAKTLPVEQMSEGNKSK